MFQGNDYKLWIINLQNQVCYINSQGEEVTVSEEGFASDIAISEGGVVWALTSTPDPDGGGAEIAWLDANQNWQTIRSKDPGAFDITGGREDQCIYRTSTGVLYNMDTQGNGKIIYDSNPVLSMDYGGGMVWGVLSDKPGEIPQLHYADLSGSLQWNEFKGIQSPTSLSVNYKGDCVGIQDFDPYVYQLPDSTHIFGSGVNDEAMQISFKNNPYLMVAEPTTNGNQIYQWDDIKGGIWVKTGLKGNRILSTYYNGGKS